MRSGRDFQRTPTTTQSAVFSGLTFTTPSREPGRYARSRRLAITPSRPIASKRSSQPSASSRSREAGESSKRLALRSRRVRRFDSGSRQASTPFQTRTSNAMKRAGISADSLLTRLSAGWSRICIASKSSTPSRSMTISPSRAESGGKQLLERAQLGEVAQQRPRVARPEAKLAGSVLEQAAEAVPLRLVLPFAARRGARARALPPSAETGSSRAGRPAARPVREGRCAIAPSSQATTLP